MKPDDLSSRLLAEFVADTFMCGGCGSFRKRGLETFFEVTDGIMPLQIVQLPKVTATVSVPLCPDCAPRPEAGELANKYGQAVIATIREVLIRDEERLLAREKQRLGPSLKRAAERVLSAIEEEAPK